MYTVNDNHTTELVNILSGHSNQETRENQMTLLGYEKKSLPKRDTTQTNRVFYQSLRKVFQLSNSPHVRITKDRGDYKHFSQGRDGYTNHFSHTIHLYRLLKNPQQRENEQKRKFSSDFASIEIFRQEILKVLWGELTHTYRIGEQRHKYINKFLSDAMPEFVYDESPYEQKRYRYYSTKIQTEEVWNEAQDTIFSVSYPQQIQERKTTKQLKSDVVLRLPGSNRHWTSQSYTESYKDTTSFEG